jgi:PHP family Zn ribbon phosphoesterase
MSDALIEDKDGLYRLKDSASQTRFIIGTEVASIKKHAGETRRVHHLIFAPTLAVARRFTQALVDRGCNVHSDGRPILGLTSKQILEIMLDIDERMMMIPAHAWTPWFGIFGAHGGYDALTDVLRN